MLPRLLPFLCLLFLSQASLCQQPGGANQAKVADTCPVTKAEDQPFVPPPPYPAKVRKDPSGLGLINCGRYFKMTEHGEHCPTAMERSARSFSSGGKATTGEVSHSPI